jgi:hypothetical protein
VNESPWQCSGRGKVSHLYRAYKRSSRKLGYIECIHWLCVLHSFDEERIPAMPAVYHGDESYKERSHAQARRVRGELVKWSFARWYAEQGGYVLEGVTHRLPEHYLETAQPDQWQRLHQESP